MSGHHVGIIFNVLVNLIVMTLVTTTPTAAVCTGHEYQNDRHEDNEENTSSSSQPQ